MSNFKKQILPITTFVFIDVKRLFRDKVAIFFVFFFPFLFLVIFGSIFNGDNDISFRVGLINNSDTAFAKDFEKQLQDSKTFAVDDEATTLGAAKIKMNRGQLDATIILPQDFGATANSAPSGQATVLYDQNNQQAGTTLATILEGVFKDINNQIAPSVEPFTVQSESTATRGLSQFDYTFSGILGFVMLSLGIFGPTQIFPRLKQRGVLRRYRTTTLKVWQYFVANVVSNAIVGLIAVALMFAVAVSMFDLNMRGNYLNLVVVVVLGIVLTFGIGLAIGGWAKNENQAAPLAQIAALPMMFLSGVFFPTFLMPDFLQRITQFIPLTPIVESIRRIITENVSLLDLGPQLAIIGVWIVVVYIAAVKLFRWE